MEMQKAEIWNIDPGHSAVQFRVRHMAIAFVNGTFGRFKGVVKSRPGQNDFNGSEVEFEIEANSINTDNQKRDDDLRSSLFFDVQQYPALRFIGTIQKENNNYQLEGNLCIRDVTKVIKLHVDFFGIGQGRFGDTRAGFELNGQINRKEFGLSWSMLTEAGGLIVGEEIKLHLDIELVKA